MKNIFKLLSLFLLVTIAVSCDSNTSDDLKYDAQTERGWVEMLDPSTVVVFKGESGSIDIDVNIQVPNTSSDLTINYEMVPVSGNDPNQVFSNSGSALAPAGETSYMGPSNNTGKDFTYLGLISLDLEELAAASLSGPMVFDVVLTGTSSSQITAGLEGNDSPISKRIIVYAVDAIAGVYGVTENFTDGVNAPFGLSDFFGESYQVELSQIEDSSSLSGFSPNTLVASNSAGFNTYFPEETLFIFESDGSITVDDSFNPGIPYLAVFSYHFLDSVVYDADAGTITGSGDFGFPNSFGPYQWVMTQQ